MTARRPLFRDGERLTAQRLNDAFGSVDDGLRRGQLGTVGAGVASGYTLSADASGPAEVLRVEPGLAIDGAGRFLVTAAPRLISLREIEDQTGPLSVGARVLVQVHARAAAASSLDPCAELRAQLADHEPTFGFAIAANRAVLSRRDAARASLAASAALPPWSDLSGRSGRELAVTLGSIELLSDSVRFSVSMAERQGLAPRGDALQNSLGQPVMSLRGDAGDPQIRLLARTFGDDITATRLGAGSGGAAASFAPSDARVFLVNHTQAVPVELDPGGGPVEAAGIPLEMADAQAGTATVRARRAGGRQSSLALGVSAAPAYTDGDLTLVPLATAGLVEVRVRAGDSGVPLGAPLQPAGNDELSIVTAPPAVIIARAAQTSAQRGGVVSLLAWVAPAQLLLASNPDLPRIG